MNIDSLPITSRKILQRWEAQAPEMVAALAASHQLLPALAQANEQVLDLLYQLTVIEKRDYHTALEIAMNEWSSLPSPPFP